MAYNNSRGVNGHLKEPLQPSESDKDAAVVVVDSVVDGDRFHGNSTKEMEMEEAGDEREHWTNGLDFILTLVGYAVGVSNLWRFPYLCLRNGGGAFLIPFFFFLFLCGVPLFYLEVCLGQFSGISSMFVWKMCPIFKGIGYGMVLVSGFACIYYNTVLSWVIYYFVNSFQSDLPWASCGHWWNTPTCIATSDSPSKSNQSSSLIMSWPLDSFNNYSSINYSSLSSLFDNDTTIRHFSFIKTNNATATTTSSGDWFFGWLNSLVSSNETLLDDVLDVNMSSLTGNATSYYFTSCHNRSSLCLLEGHGDKKSDSMTAAQEFWQYNVLRKTDGLEDLGSLQLHSSLCLFAAWVLVCLCLIRGVKSLGKVVYVTALLPYVLLTIFLIRGLMLPGALDGIKFYIKPDFSKLANFTVWIEACLQVFYSLGPAWGGLITMASFNKFDNNCFRDVMIASLADGLTSFYGGFVIFSVVGFMAHEANASVTDIATQGPGLALVAYPEAISKLPFPQLWAVLFFFMLLLLGLDSQFGMFETVIAGMIDAFPRQLKKKRMYLNFGLALFSFCISLPLATQGGVYIFTLLDWYVAAFCVMFISLLECIIIAWVYGLDRFCKDIHMMFGHYPSVFFKLCWAFITPVIMAVAFLSTCVQYTLPVYDNYVYPAYANVIGFIISFIPLIPIAIMAVVVVVCEKGSLSERLRNAIQPARDWGPAPRKYKAMYLEQQASRHKDTSLSSIFRRGGGNV